MLIKWLLFCVGETWQRNMQRHFIKAIAGRNAEQHISNIVADYVSGVMLKGLLRLARLSITNITSLRITSTIL